MDSTDQCDATIGYVLNKLHHLQYEHHDCTVITVGSIKIKASAVCILLRGECCPCSIVDAYMAMLAHQRPHLKTLSPLEMAHIMDAAEGSNGTLVTAGLEPTVKEIFKDRLSGPYITMLPFSSSSSYKPDRSILRVDLINNQLVHFDCHARTGTTNVLNQLIDCYSILNDKPSYSEEFECLRTMPLRRTDLKYLQGSECKIQECQNDCNLYNLLCLRFSITKSDVYANDDLDQWRRHILMELVEQEIINDKANERSFKKLFTKMLQMIENKLIGRCLPTDVRLPKASPIEYSSAQIRIRQCFAKLDELLYSLICDHTAYRRNVVLELLSHYSCYHPESSRVDSIKVVALEETKYVIVFDWQANDTICAIGLENTEDQLMAQTTLSSCQCFHDMIGDTKYKEISLKNLRSYSCEIRTTAIVLANIIVSAKVYHSHGKLPQVLRLMNSMFDNLERIA